MKVLGFVVVLLLATLVPPPGHGAHRFHGRPGWSPPRIIRSPQGPKVVRPVVLKG